MYDFYNMCFRAKLFPHVLKRFNGTPVFLLPPTAAQFERQHLLYHRPRTVQPAHTCNIFFLFIHPGNRTVQCMDTECVYTPWSFTMTMTTTDPQNSPAYTECFQVVAEKDFYTNSGFYGRLNISSKTNGDK